MKKIFASIVILSMLTVSAAAWSQGGWGPRGQGPGGPGGPGGRGRLGGPGMMMTCPAMVIMIPPGFMLDNYAQMFNLSAGQKTKMKSIITKHEKSMITLRKNASAANQALRKALLAPKYDAGKVKSLAAAAEKAEAAIVSANINTWSQIWGVLTAEQIKKMNALMPMPRPGQGGGQFGPPPGGGFGPPQGR